MTERIPKIKKGTIITCPDCRVEIAEILTDLYPGDMIKTSDLRGILDPITPGDRTNCRKCGSPYFLIGKLHTREGWI